MKGRASGEAGEVAAAHMPEVCWNGGPSGLILVSFPANAILRNKHFVPHSFIHSTILVPDFGSPLLRHFDLTCFMSPVSGLTTRVDFSVFAMSISLSNG